jgi:hypothetical protein
LPFERVVVAAVHDGLEHEARLVVPSVYRLVV